MDLLHILLIIFVIIFGWMACHYEQKFVNMTIKYNEQLDKNQEK